MTIPQALQIACQHHEAGRLAEAEGIYRQILAVQPNHSETLYFLGQLANQVGRPDAALGLIRQAIFTNPGAFHYHADLGNALLAQGLFEEAISAYRYSIKGRPDSAMAHNNLGSALKATGSQEEAIASYRRAVEIAPDRADYHNNLGATLQEEGQFAEAAQSLRRALQIKPDHADAWFNLGLTLYSQGHLDDAISAYRRALEAKPNFAIAHNNLGAALKAKGQFDDAVASYRKALEIAPDHLDFLINLGAALQEKGQFAEAEEPLRRALRIKPDHPNAWYNLGLALQSQGRLAEAIDAYRQSLVLKPDFALVYNNLGAALRDQGRLDEAIAAYQQGLLVEPELASLHNNLGIALRQCGRLEEAVAAHRRALELMSDFPPACNDLGAALIDLGNFDEAVAACHRALELQSDFPEASNNLGTAHFKMGNSEEAVASFRKAIALAPDRADYHSNLAYALLFQPGCTGTELAAEYALWEERHGAPLKAFIKPYQNDRSPSRRLRIGYVSPDFRDHVIGRNLLPLIESHNRDDFELLCYSGVIRPDWLTERFRGLADRWSNTAEIPDSALAEMIRADEIDILVDLSQHLMGNRLPVFARKPAPLQVSFAGYPETTGMDAIDYRISDFHLEATSPEEQPTRNANVFLIDSFWCYDPCSAEITPNALPLQDRGHVTFGCLNNFCKVNDRVLDLWAQVLRQIPDSRLMILTETGTHRQRTLDTLERQGIEAHRLEFVEPLPRQEYLGLYHRHDIALDTFPYNGHTTSLDALWMGVPVVTLAGQTPVSRAGLSQLTNLGLPELITHSEAEYVKTTVNLAKDIPRLAKLRSTLRDRMKSSVLMDARRFARQVEQTYRAMWRRWCSGE